MTTSNTEELEKLLTESLNLIDDQTAANLDMLAVISKQDMWLNKWIALSEQVNHKFTLQEELILTARDAWERLIELTRFQNQLLREGGLESQEQLDKIRKLMRDADSVMTEYTRIYELYQENRSVGDLFTDLDITQESTNERPSED